MYITYKLRLLKRRLFRAGEGERVLKRDYQTYFGKDLNMEAPVAFSEKLFSRMVLLNRYKDTRFTHFADKYLARDYVRKRIGDEYLTKLIWRGADPRRIPFDHLPARCIAKTNHGSGGNIILTPATDRREAVKKLRGWLGDNFYWAGREYQYYDIRPQILIEEFLDDGQPDGPLDYRFWCFDGKPELIQVDNRLHEINSFYDISWNKLPLHYRENFKDFDIPPPENLQDMLKIAVKLSFGFDFVRVDLYNVFGTIYFGELTFTPVGGRLRLRPESWDKALGQKWIMAR